MVDFAAFGRACGGMGLTINDRRDCRPILEEALKSPYPAIIEAVVDPNEPPMPPKVKAKQALHFAESLARGEPNRGKLALGIAQEKVRELI